MPRPAAPIGQERTTDPTFVRASAAVAAAVLAVGTLGTFYLRFRSGVPWRVPSVPYWYSFPFYVFPHPTSPPRGRCAPRRWSRSRWRGSSRCTAARSHGGRVAASAGLAFALALAVSRWPAGRGRGASRWNTPASTQRASAW